MIDANVLKLQESVPVFMVFENKEGQTYTNQTSLQSHTKEELIKLADEMATLKYSKPIGFLRLKSIHTPKSFAA